MKKIRFDNINVDLGRIEMQCRSSADSLELDDVLFFELSEDISVDDNQIAVALSTLCGKVYDEIYMDLSINRNVFEHICSFTGCEIQVNEVINEDFLSNLSEDNLMVGFSGGLDSLAEYNLLRDSNSFENIYLVSLDFGGHFSREESFFKRFKPFTVKTNFVTLKLNRNHWSFMYIPQIFFSSFLNAKYLTVSGQFHAGVYGFDESYTLSSKTDHIPISFLGMERVSYVIGLTAIGTALIDINHTPELIDLSLKSLANPKDEKRYRKQLIVTILSEKHNKKIFLEPVESGNRHKWNTRISLDFVCLYLIKHAGIDEASKVMSDIPDEAIDLANSLSLEFYEKYNVNFLNSIPEKFRSDFLQSLIKCGIYPYNSADWREYFKVSEFLSEYYPDLKKRLNG